MSQPPIVLYATRGCPRCDEARAYLRRRGAQFSEVDVLSDGRLARQLIDLTGQAVVPTIKVGVEVQIGFDESRLDEMIDHPAEPAIEPFSMIRAARQAAREAKSS